MISADQTQALVAKCLSDPLFLARVTGAAAVSEYPSTAAESVAAQVLGSDQCRRLRQFQGFITKVKHNSLRRVLPCTFRLLSNTGLELQFFTLFAGAYTVARQAGPLPTARHLDLLVPALESFLMNAPVQESTLIAEMLDHERLLHELPLAANDSPANALVVWNGRCVIVHRRFDLVDIANELKRGRVVMDPQESSHYLLYQAASAGDKVNIREIDMLTALIFNQLFAARSFSAIAQKLSATIDRVVTEGEIHAFVQEAIDAGIIASMDVSAMQDTA